MCSDCGVSLVDSLPAKAKAPGRSADHEPPVAAWRGDDPVAFSAALAALEAAGIPAKEFSRHGQFAQIFAIQPDELAILVHPDNAALAQQVIRDALEPGAPGPQAV